MALLLILALGAADPGPLVIDAGADLIPPTHWHRSSKAMWR